MDAVRHGANADEVDQGIAGLRIPQHQIRDAVVDLGGRTVSITHPGRGHTRHDLIAATPDPNRNVVFCGDLQIAGPEAVFVPGHGAVVAAAFVRRRQRRLLGQV